MENRKKLCQNQDKFPDGLVQKLTETVNYVLDTLSFVSWDEEEMRRLWRKRSLNDVLRNPQANYLFPCLDTAALATDYLAHNNEDVYLKVLTEKGAMRAFREGKSRIMHIDSLVELIYDGVPYGLDIGCGDITLLRNTESKDRNISPEEEEYFTTRPENGERIWRRTPFLKIGGKDLISNSDLSPLDFIETDYNLVKVPYNINKNDFYNEKEIQGKERILKSNTQDYNSNNLTSYNKEWLKANKDFLPGLKEFKYE
jgi:hypothetical protein